MGDGLVLDGRAVGDDRLMYGRMPRYGRGGVFLGYYYPDPAICYQYPDDYNPAVGCYGLIQRAEWRLAMDKTTLVTTMPYSAALASEERRLAIPCGSRFGHAARSGPC